MEGCNMNIVKAICLLFVETLWVHSSIARVVDLDDSKNEVRNVGLNQGETAGSPMMSLTQYYASLSQWYVFGHCDVRPNVALSKPGDVIVGNVDFKQSLRGGPTEIRVNLTGFRASSDKASRKHGFHVHEYGDLSAGCGSAGGHYNPFGVSHGSPKDSPEFRHFGDLGNVDVNSKGQVLASTRDYLISLLGPFSVFGRAIVIDEAEDDLGRGGDPGSLKSREAGHMPLACCTVGISDGARW